MEHFVFEKFDASFGLSVRGGRHLTLPSTMSDTEDGHAMSKVSVHTRESWHYASAPPRVEAFLEQLRQQNREIRQLLDRHAKQQCKSHYWLTLAELFSAVVPGFVDTKTSECR